MAQMQIGSATTRRNVATWLTTASMVTLDVQTKMTLCDRSQDAMRTVQSRPGQGASQKISAATTTNNQTKNQPSLITESLIVPWPKQSQSSRQPPQDHRLLPSRFTLAAPGSPQRVKGRQAGSRIHQTPWPLQNSVSQSRSVDPAWRS